MLRSLARIGQRHTSALKYPTVFHVTEERGFLPDRDPLTELPEPFGEVNEVCEAMPVIRRDGSAGLLARGELGPRIDSGFNVGDVSGVEDAHVLTALFRDLTFIASAYLLEPCHANYKRTKDYGLGRDTLPASVAAPLVEVADKLGSKPFMEYSQSYAMYNWKRRDAAGDLNADNLDLVRTLHGGDSERGFVAVHVAMVQESGTMVACTRRILEAVRSDNRPSFEKALLDMRAAYERIHSTFLTMWRQSRPEDYGEFRTFIMGIKSQPIFPDGVRYLGTGDDDKRHFFRGESGANDNMIPLADNVLELTGRFRENELTRTLREFRTYRPLHHQAYLAEVQEDAEKVGVRAYALADVNSMVAYAGMVDMVRAIRQTHWDMVKGYIIDDTSYPTATGGTPITTYLPNQLGMVLSMQEEGLAAVRAREETTGAVRPEMDELRIVLERNAIAQVDRLNSEVRRLAARFGQEIVE